MLPYNSQLEAVEMELEAGKSDSRAHTYSHSRFYCFPGMIFGTPIGLGVLVWSSHSHWKEGAAVGSLHLCPPRVQAEEDVEES